MEQQRGMPDGLLVLIGFGLLLLAGLGSDSAAGHQPGHRHAGLADLPAVDVCRSHLVFTLTLVFQRKQGGLERIARHGDLVVPLIVPWQYAERTRR